jgi:hypothetical protein
MCKVYRNNTQLASGGTMHRWVVYHGSILCGTLDDGSAAATNLVIETDLPAAFAPWLGGARDRDASVRCIFNLDGRGSL